MKATTSLNRSDAGLIESHLRECDSRFSPCLSSRVDIHAYAHKLATLADRFEAWDEGRLIGLVAAYLNNPETRQGFVTSVSVCINFEGAHVASELMRSCLQLARDKGCEVLELEVSENDQRTQGFYIKHGFALSGTGRSGFLRMHSNLRNQ
jgi:ribosomal protein S18 acetylase RimI-like enzyme